MTSDDYKIDFLKKLAQERIKEHQKLKKEKMEEFTNIKDGIIEELNCIEQKIQFLFDKVEKRDKLISFYREFEQAQGQLTQNRRQEICSTFGQFIECQNAENQISHHQLNSKIQRIMNYIQVTQQSMKSLIKLENDQQEGNNQNSEEGLRKKVKVEVQDLTTLNNQIQMDQIIEQICTKKICYQLAQNCVGHSDEIRAVAISYDDKYIASGGSNYQIKFIDRSGYIIIWDLKKRSVLKKYAGKYVTSLSFSKTNLKLAVGGGYSDFNEIFIYDIGNLKQNDPIQVLKGHSSYIFRTIFTNNSKQLMSCSFDKTVRIWDVDQQKEIVSKVCANFVYGLCLSDDEGLIGCCCCCSGGQAYLLDGKLGEKVKWKAHNSESCCIEFIKKSKIILTSSKTEIRFWSVDDLLNDKQEKKYLKEIQSAENNGDSLWTIKAIPVSDPTVIIASQGKLKIWQMEPIEMKQAIDMPGGGGIDWGQVFAITSDFKTIIAAQKDKQLKVYQITLI